jgi:hypothetical protein
LSLVVALAGCSGSDGEKGDAGADGAKGMPGANGADGIKGADGAQGMPGAQGTPGANGSDGADGSDGAAGGAGPEGADGANFDLRLEVPMSGELEAPAPIVTSNRGLLRVSIDSQTGSIAGSAHVSFDATHVHVHGPAFAGDTGPVLFELEADATDKRLWRIPAKTVLSAPNLAAALAGALYVNAHSAAHAVGEVRGQILPPNVSVLRSGLDTAHEVPSPKAGTDDLGSSGVGYLTLDVDSGAVHANVRTSFVATKAHVHGPAAPADAAGIAGRTSAVFEEMNLTTDSTPADDFWTLPTDTAPLDATQVKRVLAGDFYFNAHTATNATGLVRGQIHAQSVEVVRVPLSHEQEVPKPLGAGFTGLGFLTLDTDDGRLRGDVSAIGFTPTKAHIHAGKIGQTGGVALEFAGNATDATRFSAPEVGLNGSLNGVLDETQIAAFERGEMYLNMHSAANAAGEVRGQILPDGLTLVRAPMDSAHEVPAPVGAAGSSGLTLLVVDRASGHAQGFGRVGGFTATAFHIHSGAAGATGPVVIEFAADATEVGKFNLPDGVFLDPTTLADSGFYANSHSATNKTGEVRGQIVLP